MTTTQKNMQVLVDYFRRRIDRLERLASEARNQRKFSEAWQASRKAEKFRDLLRDAGDLP